MTDDDITVADTTSEPDAVPGDPPAADLDSLLSDVRAQEPEMVETVATPETAVPFSTDAVLVEAVAGGLTWIPFACYLGLWVLLAGLSAYFLYGATAELPARWMPEYVPLLWSGLSLTALGPILSVTVWLFARGRRPKGARRGLFASAMTRGALAAFFGVAIWVATLFVLEIVAMGGAL